jgi:cytochrome c oxidase subunit 2
MLSSVSDSARSVDQAFLVILGVCVALFLLILSLMAVFLVRYRRSRHPVAVDIEGNLWLEVLWTVVPVFIVLGMFYFGWVGYRNLRHAPEGTPEVDVIGRMWSWTFLYPNGVRTDTLYLPVGRPVELELRSMDVIHSFFVPAFRVKQDLVPGMETSLWFTPEKPGRYDILCAEYCGERHAYMRSALVVLPADSFDRWLEAEGKAMREAAVTGREGGETAEDERVRLGERLASRSGCFACHTTDGTKGVGPTFRGLFGREETVVTEGATRKVRVTEDYIVRSILDPKTDVVAGYPDVMPPQRGMLSEAEARAIAAYIASLEEVETP